MSFLRTSLHVFSINAVGKVLAILTTVVFARWMGAENLGSFSTFMALVGVLATVALLGFPTLHMREIARSPQGALVRTVTPITVSAVGLLALTAIISLAVGQVLYHSALIPALGDVREYVHILLPITLLGITIPRYAGSTLVGLGYARTVTIIDTIVKSVLLLVLAALWFWSEGPGLLTGGTRIAMEFAVAAIIAFLLYLMLFAKAPLSHATEKNSLSKPRITAAWRGAIGFAGIDIAQVIFVTIDVLVLGLFVAADQVGIYKVAAAASALLLFPMESMSAVYAPRIARGYPLGEIGAINRDMQRLGIGVLVLALPLLLVFVFIPAWPIGLLFGESFSAAASVLTILSLGVGLRLLLGPVGWALTMSGHERVSMYTLLAGATLNLVLNLVLIPLYGVTGAAVATALATFVTYGAMAMILRAQTGIETWPFRISAAS